MLFKSHAGFYTTLVTARKLCLATLNSDEKIKATLTLFNNYRKNLAIDSCILTTCFLIKGVVSETKTVVLCQWEIETKKLVWKQLFLRVELALKKITTLRICVLALWAQLFQSRLTSSKISMNFDFILLTFWWKIILLIYVFQNWLPIM